MSARILPYLLVALSFFSFPVYSQVSPVKLSTKWYFGNFGGLDFSAGAPVVLTGGKVDSWGQEGSTAITDLSGNVVFYTDGYELFDGSHNFIQYVRGGTSSTQNSVAIPDPADPDKRYYLFTANVEPSSGGERTSTISELGINYYHIEKNASTISVIAGPVQIARPNEVSEQLCVGTDLSGNYWVVSHQGGDWAGWNMRNIYSWQVTSAGVSNRIVSSIAGATGNNPWLGSLKINKCQTRLAAVYSTGVVEIYEWDATTGKVTALTHRTTGYPALYGCEFSPNGNVLYFTADTGNKLYQLDVATDMIYTESSWKSVNNREWMGTLQLGPDNKIYVTNGNHAGSAGGTPSYIGVVNDPDIAGAGCNYNGEGLLLNSGPDLLPNIERGIANIAWLAPKLEMYIDDQCPDFSFSYSAKNYFNENIPVIPGSEEWNFDEGAGFETGLGENPSHSFTQTGADTVKLRFKDQACNRTWLIHKRISVNCVLPVTWLSFDAQREGANVAVNWSTSFEANNKEFIVERSEDGQNFLPIGTVGSSGNEAGGNYFYNDYNPTFGNNYYRIKQVDFNGAFQYSQVEVVKNEQVAISVFPNPSRGAFKIIAPVNLVGTVYVLDALGREVYAHSYTGDLSFGEDLTAGCYIVKIVSDHFAWSGKVIKEF